MRANKTMSSEKSPAGFRFDRDGGGGNVRKSTKHTLEGNTEASCEGVRLEMAAFRGGGGRDLTHTLKRQKAELGRSFCAMYTRQGSEFRVSLPVGITAVNL